MNIVTKSTLFLTVTLVSVFLITTQVVAADMSGWSDKTVCRLVKSGGHSDINEEATLRKLDCEAPEKSKKKQIITSGHNMQFHSDENTRPQDYSLITDPTGIFDEKVHRFQITSKCGTKVRQAQTNRVGKLLPTDCAENSVRSEITLRPKTQPTHRWYSWNVYLPNDYPIQDTGKLLLAQFHSSECPHLSFTSRGGRDDGRLYYETMKLWKGDCKSTVRKQITSIQDLRGKWTNFTLEMIWKNNETGVANLWLDGEQVLAHRGPTLTLKKEHKNYLKVGIYQCCNKKGIAIKPANLMFTTPKSGPTRDDVY
jgi:hypothetical protein